MSDQPWLFEHYRTSALEGEAPVPGGVLKYRLAGAANAGELVVFESGWSAPFPYAVWLEQALAPQVGVLCYDRAGVGDSRATAPPGAAGMTRQLLALLDGLGIHQPVVVAGHSYGGLIGALHAAQAPERVRAVVQIDPTPEFSNELLDPSYRSLPAVARLMQLCAWLRIDGPLFMDLPRELPPQVFARVKRDPAWLVRSFSGSLAEIRLLDQIRGVVTAPAARQCPRLVISGSPRPASDSWLRKLVMSDAKARRYWDTVHQLHRRQAGLHPASRWINLPYSHVSLVTDRAGAAEVAALVLGFMR